MGKTYQNYGKHRAMEHMVPPSWELKISWGQANMHDLRQNIHSIYDRKTMQWKFREGEDQFLARAISSTEKAPERS